MTPLTRAEVERLTVLANELAEEHFAHHAQTAQRVCHEHRRCHIARRRRSVQVSVDECPEQGCVKRRSIVERVMAVR